jgi:Spy/CpxP family protein refolding chaperone
MRKTWFIPAVLASAVALATPAFAEPPASPEASEGQHGGHWRHMMMMSPFLRDLHQLNLSDAQKSQIRDLVKTDRENMKTQFQTLRQQHLAFERAVPGSADFETAASVLAQAAAAAAQTRVQTAADLHTKIYALLTDAQKSQLATLLAQTPNPEAPDSPEE